MGNKFCIIKVVVESNFVIAYGIFLFTIKSIVSEKN